MPLPAHSWALPVGFVLDALVGDPRGWPHPVRAVGWLIRRTEALLRKLLKFGAPDAGLEYAAGVILLVVVAGATGVADWVLMEAAGKAGGACLMVFESLSIYWGLAVKSLGVEALRASEEPELAVARVELSMIVGRDTAALDRPEICRACVETVAENCNDAVVAPLFWFALGGTVGLWVYKSVNTLDSMVGYRNEQYRRLGWASARLDDLAGLIPARLTCLLISLAAAALGESATGALRIGLRDGRKHPSPNAGWGEAAMAGALGVQLGGRASYQGVYSEKPRLGDPGEAIGPATVRRAVRVMKSAAVAAACLTWVLRFWVLRRA